MRRSSTLIVVVKQKVETLSGRRSLLSFERGSNGQIISHIRIKNQPVVKVFSPHLLVILVVYGLPGSIQDGEKVVGQLFNDRIVVYFLAHSCWQCGHLHKPNCTFNGSGDKIPS
jgi:hypothetical protein